MVTDNIGGNSTCRENLTIGNKTVRKTREREEGRDLLCFPLLLLTQSDCLSRLVMKVYEVVGSILVH